MNQSLVEVRVQDHVGQITLNRPEKRNALNRELITALEQAFFDLHQQRSVRAVILTGHGPAFCAGMDLSEMLDTREKPNAYQLWQEDADTYLALLEQMLRFPKPIIAAVNGPALAGGAGLVLACDMAVAAEGATFGLPEPRRGLVAGIVSPLLVFRIGAGYSAYLMLSAEIIGTKHACSIGIFHEAVDAERLHSRVHELANNCARCAPEALQLSKKMLNETIGEHLVPCLAAGAAASAAARTTDAAAEGLKAFLEKRNPQWK